VLDKVPIDLTSKEAGGIMARALTVGEEDFKQANGLVQIGKTDEAIAAFQRLRKEYPATWIDLRSEEQLAKLRIRPESVSLSGPAVEGEGRGEAGGLAAKYPGDVGLTNDPDVLFADDFESGDMKKWDE